jgi:hypothetical protein
MLLRMRVPTANPGIESVQRFVKIRKEEERSRREASDPDLHPLHPRPGTPPPYT